jgi:hypothetical protein
MARIVLRNSSERRNAMTTMQQLVPLALASTLALAAGCGDSLGANGEHGRISYSLGVDYEFEVDDLTAQSFATHHEHTVQIDLTSDGERELGDADPDDLVHTADGAEIVDADGSHFTFVAAEPGEVTVRTELDGAVFDEIVLRADAPTRLDLVRWVRAPWEDEAAPSRGIDPLTVAEGSQISFLAIPMAGQKRLISDFTPAIAASAEDLVVPTQQVYGVYEEELWVGGEPVTFVAIEPGAVSFTLGDPDNGVEVVQDITIE